MMKLQSLGLSLALPALLLTSTVASASVRPQAVAFGSSSQAPLKTSGARKSAPVAADNALNATGTVVGVLAVVAAGLGLYFALDDHDDDSISAN